MQHSVVLYSHHLCHFVIYMMLQNNQDRKTRYFSQCLIFWPEMRLNFRPFEWSIMYLEILSTWGFLAYLHCLSIISNKSTAYNFLVLKEASDMK